MTYRRMLIALLAGTVVWLGWLASDSATGARFWAAANPRTILAAEATPKDGFVPVSRAYVGRDGTLYFVGSGKNALVRDPDGNLRTLPLSAMPR
jgi:hypothetical protein